MVNEYYIGQLVHATAFFNISGVATDPTQVTAKVRDPNGLITSPAATKDSVGNYHVDVDVETPGRWFVRFAGTGACQAASEQAFDVLLGNFQS